MEESSLSSTIDELIMMNPKPTLKLYKFTRGGGSAKSLSPLEACEWVSLAIGLFWEDDPDTAKGDFHGGGGSKGEVSK